MNRLKFMDAPVDEDVHQEAHAAIGAERVAQEAGFNWAYLAYNWGFPPEIEQEDWEAFRQAVPVYHQAGVKVFGYIQTSNCVFQGSFRKKDWYARDPKGRKFYYDIGRYMTCWLHPEWLGHLRDNVRGAVEAGADGIFFDNPWHACQPLHVAGAWIGSAGCYCSRCRDAFRESCSLEIPRRIDPEGDEVSRQYLFWRAGQVTETLTMLANYARSLKSDVVISANDFDAVMRPSLVMTGIDLPALAKVQDVLMIEDYGLPRWDNGNQKQPKRSQKSPEANNLLINNVLTIRTARALVGNTPLSTDPYDRGIGFDGMYPVRRFQQGIAEAAACGAMLVVKGTEFVEDGQFTLLTAERFEPQRQAIGRYHRWLEEHASLYENRKNIAPVGLLYPGDALWQQWDAIAPLYFGAGQTLLAAGIPWRVLTEWSDPTGIEILLTFKPAPHQPIQPDKTKRKPRLSAYPLPALPFQTDHDLRIINVPYLHNWSPPPPGFLARHSTLRRLSTGLIGNVYRDYFRSKRVRRYGDRLGLAHFFLQSPYFQLPPDAARSVLIEALGKYPFPRVMAKQPVLAELWQQGETRQLHLVNYDAEPQSVVIAFGDPIAGKAFSPDGSKPYGPEPYGSESELTGDLITIHLDIYTVLTFTYSNTTV
jgi:hypothetical protein